MAITSRRDMQREIRGQASSDVDPKTGDLYVTPMEALPFIKGELKATEIQNDVNTKNASGSYKGQVKTTNAIKAAYYKDATNRDTWPIIRSGEQVTLINYADTDVWYWKTDGRNDQYRRLDQHRISISGSRENASDIRNDNSYYMEMDTFNDKKIEIATSMADGEKHRYMIKIDSKNSKIFIGDGDAEGDAPSNMIVIDSEVPEIILTNKKKSFINIKGEDIFINAERHILMQAKKIIDIKSGEEMNLTSGKDMNQNVGKAWNINYGTTGNCEGKGNMEFKVNHMSIRKY